MARDKRERAVHETPITYEEYANLPDDGQRYELVDGTLECMTSPNRSHQLLVTQLISLLLPSCSAEYTIVPAPIDVVISNHEVRQPDLVMFHSSRMHIYKPQGCIVEPPEIVMEILSPWSLRRDKIDKRHSYAKFGVPEYWMVNPEDESIEQHVLIEDCQYDLVNVYTAEDVVRSEYISCVLFTVNDLMSRIRNLPEN